VRAGFVLTDLFFAAFASPSLRAAAAIAFSTGTMRLAGASLIAQQLLPVSDVHQRPNFHPTCLVVSASAKPKRSRARRCRGSAARSHRSAVEALRVEDGQHLGVERRADAAPVVPSDMKR
jgi:hypothetical protein